MAISSVLAFTEPDQMEAAHVAVRSAEAIPTAREGLIWHVTRAELDQCLAGPRARRPSKTWG